MGESKKGVKGDPKDFYGVGLGYVLGLAPSMLGDSRDSPGQLGGDDRNAQYIPLE